MTASSFFQGFWSIFIAIENAGPGDLMIPILRSFQNPLQSSGMPFARRSAEWNVRGDAMPKPHPPLSRLGRNGQAPRRCGVGRREGSGVLRMKLVPDGREILRRSV